MTTLLFLALILFTTPLGAEAQGAGTAPRVGYIGNNPDRARALTEAFRRGLHDLGYREGENLVLEWRWAHGRAERLEGLARELVTLGVAVIVTGNDRTTAAVQRVTSTIPIVMAISSDPVAAGLVESLARPGGNVTGLSGLSPALAAKRVQLLHDALPGRSRVAFLRTPDPGNPASLAALQATEEAAATFGLVLRRVEVAGPEGLPEAFRDMVVGRTDALLVSSQAFGFRHHAQIAALATAHGLPALSFHREFVQAGGLLSYGVDLPDLWRRAAGYVDRILRGVTPGDLPVERPTKFTLAINLKTAKALALTIPQSILIRADEIIQ